MPKKWFLILPIILLSIFFFQNWIISSAVQYSFVKKLETVLDSEVTYQSVERSGSSVKFLGLEAKKNEKNILEAKEISIDYDLNWFKRELDIHVKALEPIVLLTNDHIKVPEASPAKYYSVKTSLEVVRGVWGTRKGVVLFQMETDPDLKIEFGESHIARQENGWDLNLVDFPLDAINQVLGLFGHARWENISGIANGHIFTSFPAGLSPTASGKLTIDNLAYASGRNRASVSKIDLSLDDVKPVSSLYPLLNGKLNFKGASVSGWQNELAFELKDLDGFISFNSSDEITIKFTGVESIEGDHKIIDADFLVELNRLDKISVTGSL
ncbi:MAG: hypothetical protein ACK4HV_03650, partial [Parachlamydiaceae bacterium]